MLSRIVDAVRRSGKMIAGAEGFTVEDKGTRENVVTSMDVENERFLRRELTAIIPGSEFVGEESGGSGLPDRGYAWIVDPIDGTMNYSRGIPEVGISVGLMKDGEPYAGVVHNPFNGAMYSAVRGGGACKGDRPISVRRRPLEDCIMCTAWSAYDKSLAMGCFRVSERMLPVCNDIRRIGTAAMELCMLAEGAADLYFEARLCPWDFAAASVILTEAGGYIRSLEGPLDYGGRCSVIASADPSNLDYLLGVVGEEFGGSIPRRSLLQQVHRGHSLDGLVLGGEEGIVQPQRRGFFGSSVQDGIVPLHADILQAQVVHP